MDEDNSHKQPHVNLLTLPIELLVDIISFLTHIIWSYYNKYHDQ